MNLFITGATGYIGSVVTEHAINQGHSVSGLSRSDKGDAQLLAIGARPVRGDLTSIDILATESHKSDAVLHLAYIHDWGMDYNEILRIDAQAVDALGRGLRGSGKPLVITSGTTLVAPAPLGQETNEDSPLSSTNILKDRIHSERHALKLQSEGIRVSAIRLPPYVHGRGGSYFAPLLMQLAATAGESIYVDEGQIFTSSVHVDDAADLYLLVAKKASAGEIFNATGSTSISLKALAETIAAALNIPTRSATYDEARAAWGDFLVSFVQYENRSSNHKAVSKLGWKPKNIDLLTDLLSGSYKEMARTLRR